MLGVLLHVKMRYLLGFVYIKLFASVAVHPICRQEAHCLAFFA